MIYVTGSDITSDALVADVVFEEDKEPKYTGIINEKGEPIYRINPAVPFGFQSSKVNQCSG